MANNRNLTLIAQYKGPDTQIQPLANRMIEYIQNTPASKVLKAEHQKGSGLLKVYINYGGLRAPLTGVKKDRYLSSKSIHEKMLLKTDVRQELDDLVKKYEKLQKDHDRVTTETISIVEEQGQLIKEKDALKEKVSDLESVIKSSGRTPMSHPNKVSDELNESRKKYENEQSLIISEAYALSAGMMGDRQLYDGDISKANEILDARKKTMDTGAFEYFPDEAKDALRASWKEAQTIVDNSKSYFSEKNRIPLLAQIKYENNGFTVSVSVKSDAEDDISMQLKEAFNNFAGELQKEAPKSSKTEFIDGEYLILHHEDKCTVASVNRKLYQNFRRFQDQANIGLVVLKDNIIQTDKPRPVYNAEIKTLECTPAAYKDCTGLKDLVSHVAKAKGFRSTNAMLKSDRKLNSIYPYIIRENKARTPDAPLALAQIKPKAATKFAKMLDLDLDVFGKFVDIK